MAITRPTSEQLRFVSSKTGEHILDTYMENAELGDRTIAQMLGDIFNASTGIFDPTIFSVRVLTTDNNKLQVRVGTANSYVDSGVEIFNARGTYATSTAYKVLDIATKDQDTFVCTVAHTSSNATPDASKFLKIIDGTLVKNYANKVDGAVSGSDYSAKAWAVGGTGITDTAGKGAASEWAIKVSGTVDGTNYSAKYWATSTNVTTVANGISNINTVATNIANVNTVGGISANVTSVAGIASDVTAVAGDASDIGTVSTNIANVNTVAGISANVTAVAGDATDIGTVATNLAGTDTIGAVAGSIANVNTVAGIDSNITAVANNASNINTVAGIDSNVTTVAGISSAVSSVSSNTSNVNAVAGSISNVNTVASSINNVNTFATTYFIGGSAPGGVTTGDLWYDTSSNAMKVYNGSSFVSSAGFANIAIGDLSNVATTTPTANQGLVYNTGSSAFVPTTLNLQTIADIGASTTTAITVPNPTANGHAANKTYVDTAVANVVDSAPAALDTLNELAAALGDDSNFATTTNNAIAAKLPLAGGTMTGDIDFDNNKVTDVTLENFQEIIASNTSVTGAQTIPDATNNVRYTLVGGTTVTLPDTDELPAGTARSVTIFVKQDGTGGRTFTLAAPGGYTIKYNSSSTQPAVNASANKETIYTALLVKGSTTIYVSLSFYEA